MTAPHGLGYSTLLACPLDLVILIDGHTFLKI